FTPPLMVAVPVASWLHPVPLFGPLRTLRHGRPHVPPFGPLHTLRHGRPRVPLFGPPHTLRHGRLRVPPFGPLRTLRYGRPHVPPFGGPRTRDLSGLSQRRSSQLPQRRDQCRGKVRECRGLTLASAPG